MNPTTDNQYLDTNQSINQTQNELNLNSRQTNQPNLLPNMNNNTQITQNYNPQFNPQATQNYNPQFTPQITQNYNPQFNPQITQNYTPSFSPQITQTYAPSFNPVIQTAPQQINVNVPIPVKKVTTKRTITGPVNLGLESKKITCPFCEEEIDTVVEKSTNMKALITAIATLYIGFVMIQTCRGKAVGWEDCQHSCPKCNKTIGYSRTM
jgi:hypothetical protein